MKKILFLLICIVNHFGFAQEMVKSTPISIPKKSDVFQIVEENKKQVTLFFSSKNKVQAVRFNESFSVIDSLSTPSPTKDYDNIVGYSLSDNRYYVYWSDSGNKKILSQCFDFDSKKVQNTPLALPIEKEKFVKKITVNNIFYMISIVKGTGILNFYILNDGKLTKKTTNLSSMRFLGRDDKITTLWEIVSSSTNYEFPYSFQTITKESPASLAFSANKRKIYILENKLLFTLDNNRRFTQTFTIDLNDFSATTKMFMQPSFPEDEAIANDNGQSTYYAYDSNSFFLDDKIIQIKNNADYMKLSIKDMEGQEKKQLLINQQEISFKNSDILQENGSVKSLRVLDKSSQLLRKINGELNPSVSLFETNQKIYMTIGGVSVLQQNNGIMIGGLIGGFTGALIGAALTSNYSMDNLNSYRGRKVVYINCLFDKDFNSIPGEKAKLAFDKVRVFAEENDYLNNQSLFKMNQKLFVGGYDKEKQLYSFYQFEN